MKYIAQEDAIYIDFDGNSYNILKGEEYVSDEKYTGYLAEGLPTDSQVELQDSLDSMTMDFTESMLNLLLEYGYDFSNKTFWLCKLRKSHSDIVVGIHSNINTLWNDVFR